MHDLTFSATREEAFLCHAIRHIDRIDAEWLIAEYRALGDELIYAASEKNGVTSIVGHSLITHIADQVDLPPHWKAAFVETESRISEYMEELDRVADALAEHSIALLALKNSGITRNLYRHPGASPMGDLDVLIDPNNFHRAHEVMEGLGYILKFRNEYENEDIDEAFAGGGAEYSATLPSGRNLWFELQWRPIAGRWITPDQEPKAAELLSRAVKCEGNNVLLLSPEDNLLQVCLHTAKHSFIRAPGFRLHTDVERIVTTQDIDWDLFAKRVRDLRVCTATYLSLAMARSLLGSEVPEKVLDAIKPPAWKVRLMTKWLDKVSIFNPEDPKWSNPGFMLFVALLYDDARDIMRTIIPPTEELKRKYEGVTPLNAPLFHMRRVYSLIAHRTGI